MRSKRRKRKSEPVNRERWLVSYADFITLLFAFFVVMYATSQKDMGKAKEFEESVKKHLIKMGMLNSSSPKKIKLEEVKSTPVTSDLFKHSKKSPEMERVQKVIELDLEKSMSKTEFSSIVKDITDDSLGVRLSLSIGPLFEKGSFVLKKSAFDFLFRLGKVLKKTRKRILVEGHTDERPQASKNIPEKWNGWELGALRASGVVRFLTHHNEIPSDRFVVVSYGDGRPLFPKTSPKNRQRNRRLDFLILTEDAPI